MHEGPEWIRVKKEQICAVYQEGGYGDKGVRRWGRVTHKLPGRGLTQLLEAPLTPSGDNMGLIVDVFHFEIGWP